MNIFSKLFKKPKQPSADVRGRLGPQAKLLCKAFPKKLQDDVTAVCKLLCRNAGYDSLNEVLGLNNELNLNGELVQIPQRIYYCELIDNEIQSLTETQRTVLYCIFTRSDNGYLREKYVRLLLANNYPQWTIPFIVKLSDDYVCEIVAAVYELLKDKDTSDIRRFCLENKNAVHANYGRMLNYWYEYYKTDCPDFYEYVGRRAA